MDWEGPVASQGLELGLAVTRAPTVSREDFRPQAILKFHCPSSLDYRPRYGLLVTMVFMKLTVLDYL